MQCPQSLSYARMRMCIYDHIFGRVQHRTDRTANLSLPSLHIPHVVTVTSHSRHFHKSSTSQLSSVFWWLNLVRRYALYKVLYPKGGNNLPL